MNADTNADTTRTELTTAADADTIGEGDHVVVTYESVYADRGNEQEIEGEVLTRNTVMAPETDDGYLSMTLYVDTDDDGEADYRVDVDSTAEGEPMIDVETPRRSHDAFDGHGGLTSRTSTWSSISRSGHSLEVAETVPENTLESVGGIDANTAERIEVETAGDITTPDELGEALELAADDVDAPDGVLSIVPEDDREAVIEDLRRFYSSAIENPYADDEAETETEFVEADADDVAALEQGDEVRVTYESAYGERGNEQTAEGVVEGVEDDLQALDDEAIYVIRLFDDDAESHERDEYFADLDAGNPTRRLRVAVVEGEVLFADYEGKNGVRWNRLNRSGSDPVAYVRADGESDEDGAQDGAATDGGETTADPDYSLTDAERAAFGHEVATDGGQAEDDEGLPLTYKNRGSFSHAVQEQERVTLTYEASNGTGEQTVEGVVGTAHLTEWVSIEADDGHVYHVYGIGLADREPGDVTREDRKVGEFERAVRHGPVRADGSGETTPALDDEGDLWAAAERVSEGDEAAVSFDNRYDLRYADETTEGGTVAVADHDPSDGGVVALRVENDDRHVSVKANGEVIVRKPGEARGDYVGRVTSSRWHGPAQSDAAEDEDREVCTDGGVTIEGDGPIGAAACRAATHEVNESAPRVPSDRRPDLAAMRHERLESAAYHLRGVRVRCERRGDHDAAHAAREEREVVRTELFARRVSRYARDHDDGRFEDDDEAGEDGGEDA